MIRAIWCHPGPRRLKSSGVAFQWQTKSSPFIVFSAPALIFFSVSAFLSGDKGTCELKISEGSWLGLGLCPQRTHAWVIKISIHHFYSSHNVFAWDIATNYSQCVIWLHRIHCANNHNNVLSLLQLRHPLLCLLIFWNCAGRLKAVEREVFGIHLFLIFKRKAMFYS